ncbi:MAG: hypothetical protein K2Q22_05985 [Cytophagales bacterium]|nr:hypothetical protein [Cytophagales bacterium]
MATLTHQLISFSEVEEEIGGQTLVRPILSNERPAVCERKTALSPEYMADLAVRVEKMCELIFNLKGQGNRMGNLN